MEFENFKCYESHYLTGSSYICNPTVMDTDVDYVVLCHDKVDFLDECAKHMWDVCYDGEYPENDDFCSVRKDNINLIVTGDYEFYYRFIAATEIAKAMNLIDKEDRVSLFQGVLYGNLCGFLKK